MMMLSAVAFGDFSGGDSLSQITDKWNFLQEGDGNFYAQNSRHEFIVENPFSQNRATLVWRVNEGGYRQNWFVQVDTHLELVSLSEGNGINLGLYVGNSNDPQLLQSVGSAIDRFREDGIYRSRIIRTDDQANFYETDSTARDSTIRLHFDSGAKTITASWNVGQGWQYAPPLSITRWGMNDSSTFYAYLNARNSGNNAGSLYVGPGDASFSNFITGNTTPDISIQEPTAGELTDANGKNSFGSATVKSGKITKIFTIRNQGTFRLERIKIRNKGANPKDFIFTKPQKTTLEPGDFTTFKVTFKPKVSGRRKTEIQITSNDPDESSFDIPLIGRGTK
jgi:hypothetical protein